MTGTWTEGLHPRGAGGEFATKNGGSQSAGLSDDTRKRIAAYQKANGLKVTGIPDAATLAKSKWQGGSKDRATAAKKAATAKRVAGNKKKAKVRKQAAAANAIERRTVAEGHQLASAVNRLSPEQRETYRAAVGAKAPQGFAWSSDDTLITSDVAKTRSKVAKLAGPAPKGSRTSGKSAAAGRARAEKTARNRQGVADRRLARAEERLAKAEHPTRRTHTLTTHTGSSRRGGTPKKKGRPGVATSRDSAGRVVVKSTNLSVDEAAQVTLELAVLAVDGVVSLERDGTIDLAPGDYHPPFDWKHGYIPLTPAAALSKAHKSSAGAAKVRSKYGVKGARKPSAPTLPGKRDVGTKAALKATGAVKAAQTRRENRVKRAEAAKLTDKPKVAAETKPPAVGTTDAAGIPTHQGTGADVKPGHTIISHHVVGEGVVQREDRPKVTKVEDYGSNHKKITLASGEKIMAANNGHVETAGKADAFPDAVHPQRKVAASTDPVLARALADRRDMDAPLEGRDKQGVAAVTSRARAAFTVGPENPLPGVSDLSTSSLIASKLSEASKQRTRGGALARLTEADKMMADAGVPQTHPARAMTRAGVRALESGGISSAAPKADTPDAGQAERVAKLRAPLLEGRDPRTFTPEEKVKAAAAMFGEGSAKHKAAQAMFLGKSDQHGQIPARRGENEKSKALDDKAAELRARAQGIADQAGTGDRAAGRLSAPTLKKVGAKTDRDLAAYTKAQQAASALTSKAHLERARERSRSDKASRANRALTAGELQPGDIITDHHHRSHVVTKVNKATVSVPSSFGLSEDDKVHIGKINGHIPVSQLTDDQLERLATKEGLPASARAVFRAELDRRKGSPGKSEGVTPQAGGATPLASAPSVVVKAPARPVNPLKHLTPEQLAEEASQSSAAGRDDEVRAVEAEIDRRDRLGSTTVAGKIGRLSDDQLDALATHVMANDPDGSRIEILGKYMDDRDGGIEPGKVNRDPILKAALADIAREAKADAKHQAAARQRGLDAEWHASAHARMLEAESATNGNVLNKRVRGDRDAITRALFEGKLAPARMRKAVTPELAEWFAQNGWPEPRRVTLGSSTDRQKYIEQRGRLSEFD